MSLRVVSQSSDSTDSLDRESSESSESVESVVESRVETVSRSCGSSFRFCFAGGHMPRQQPRARPAPAHDVRDLFMLQCGPHHGHRQGQQ